MAIYSFSAGVFSRSKGHRVTAAAAYRAGAVIEDKTIGERFDYSRKRGVVHSEILAPDNAPEWMHDRAALWNAVESQERRSDSQLARDIMLAIPHELDESDQLALVRDFIREEFVARGMVADFSIHAPAGDDARNWHAHILLTLRPVEGETFGKKAREWNRDELLNHWREAWADHCNSALEEAGFDARVDHRSLDAQGIDRVPGEHKGKATTAQERRGKTTPRSGRHDDIARDNDEMARLADELAAIDRQIAEREQRRLDILYGPADEDMPLFDDAAGVDEQQEPDALDDAFAARWGDDWQLKRTGDADHAALAPATPADTSEQHSGWRRFVDRARAFQARAEEFWHDETSGGVAESDRGFAARVFDSGRKLLHGYSRRNVMEIKEGFELATGLIHEVAADPSGSSTPAAAPTPPKSWSERARELGQEFLHNERGGGALNKLDRYARDWMQQASPDEEPDADPPAVEPDTPDIE
jgi:hypothetical protein